MNSVLLLFSFSQTCSIQDFISGIEESMIVLVSISSLWLSLLDLKVLLILWSSANPFKVNWVTSSSKVEA